MADINLLPQEERENEQYFLLVKRLQVAAVGALVVTAILVIITLVMFTTFSSRKAGFSSQIEDLSSKINGLKAQEELLVVIKDKVGNASRLSGARVEYHSLFNKLAAIIPQGVYFTDVRVTSGKAVISGKARSSNDVAGLVSAVTSARGTEIISDVSIDTLSSDETGIFSYVISGKVIGD